MLKQFCYIKIFILVLLLPAFNFAQTGKIAVLYSDYTKNLDAEHSRLIDDNITLIEYFLMEAKYNYEVIYDDVLEDGLDDNYKILILPTVSVFSEDEFNSLKLFMENGNSVLSIGSDFSFDENGLSGKNRFEDFFDLKIIEKSFSKIPNVRQNISSFLPLGIDNLNDGSLLTTTSPSFNFYAPNDPYRSTVTFITGQELNVSDEFLTTSIYGVKNNGRYFVCSFNFSSIIGGQEDKDEFNSLLNNIINWLSFDATFKIKNLPDDFDGSVVYTIENQNIDAGKIVEILKKENVTYHLIIEPNQNIGYLLESDIKNEHLILNLENFAAESGVDKNELIEMITTFNKKYNLEISSLLVKNSLLDESLLKKFSDIGVKTILISDGLNTKPERKFGILLISSAPELNIPIYYEDGILFPWKPIEIINYSAKAGCDNSDENSFLRDVYSIANSPGIWNPTLDQLADWYSIIYNISLKTVNKNVSSFDLVLVNDNLNEVRNLKIIGNLKIKENESDPIVSSAGKRIDYLIDKKTGNIKIFIDVLRTREIKTINFSFNNL